MPKPYYYADANSQPVGPLSLDEIRRYAEAGVVPADVKVCEAEGENWRSLETFAPSATDLEVHSVESTEPPPSAGSLKLLYSITLVTSLIAFLLDAASTRAAVENDGVAPNVASENLAMIASLVALVLAIALIYQLVSALPEKHRFTSPVKAAGFYLIPIFSLYWVFRLFLGLLSSSRKWVREIAPSKDRHLSWFVPFAVISAVFVAAGEVLSYFDAFGTFEQAQVVNAKRIYLLVYLGYAASEVAFFHFTLTILQLLRGLVDPEDLQRESEKRRGFFSLGPRGWNPAYAYVFFILAVAAWR